MQNQLAELSLRLEHRHSDGSWGELKRSPHDVTDLDPERDWAKGGAIYVCTTCDEKVRVSAPDGGLLNPGDRVG